MENLWSRLLKTFQLSPINCYHLELHFRKWQRTSETKNLNKIIFNMYRRLHSKRIWACTISNRILWRMLKRAKGLSHHSTIKKKCSSFSIFIEILKMTIKQRLSLITINNPTNSARKLHRIFQQSGLHMLLIEGVNVNSVKTRLLFLAWMHTMKVTYCYWWRWMRR